MNFKAIASNSGRNIQSEDSKKRSYHIQVGNADSGHKGDESNDLIESGDSDDDDDDDDNEQENSALPLTEQTILWLTKRIAFQNFKSNLLRSALLPLEYVKGVLEP